MTTSVTPSGGIFVSGSDPVHFGDRVFPTAMHALEAQRFVNTRPDVVDEIAAACQTPDDVRVVVSRRVAHSHPDCGQIMLQKVSPSVVVLSRRAEPSDAGPGDRWTRCSTPSSRSTRTSGGSSLARWTSRYSSARSRTTSGAMAPSGKARTSWARLSSVSGRDSATMATSDSVFDSPSWLAEAFLR